MERETLWSRRLDTDGSRGSHRRDCGRSDGTIFCGRITKAGLIDVTVNELQ